MDPDATLAELRELVASVNVTNDAGETEHLRIHSGAWITRMAELAEGLDEWISEGGHLPRAWRGSKGDDAVQDDVAEHEEWLGSEGADHLYGSAG